MIETSFVKMVKTVGECVANEQYEIDSDTAKKYIDAGLAESVSDPRQAIFDKVAKSVDEKINSAMECLADKINIKSAEPRITTKPEAKSLGDFASLVATKQYTKLVNKYGEKVLASGTDTAIVPSPLSDQLLYSPGWDNNIVGLCNQVAMATTSQTFPVLDQAGQTPTNNESSFLGGIVGTFGIEDSDASSMKPDFVPVTITAKKFTMYTEMTPEIRIDSVIDLDNFLTQKIPDSYRRQMNQFLINGNSAFDGLVSGASTVSVTRKTAGHINWLDVVSMFARRASPGEKYVWVTGGTGYSELLNMEDTSGRLISTIVLNNLLGCDIIQSEVSPVLGQTGDLLLVNLRHGYNFGQVVGYPRLSFSDQYNFLKGRRTFKLESYVGGKATHASTITLADETTEVGEIIQLSSGS